MTSNKQWWHELRQREARIADLHDERSSLANPYYSAFAWWWDDSMGHEYGPYATQSEALFNLLKFMQPKKDTLWQALKRLLSGKSRQH